MATTNGLALCAAERQELATLEQEIKDGLQHFVSVGNALARIRDKRLYREKFKTFEAYCGKTFRFTTGRARQLMRAAGVTDQVQADAAVKSGTIVPLLVPNEGVARELAKVPESDRVDVLAAASEGGKEPTAKDVRDAAAKQKASEPPPPVDAEGRPVPDVAEVRDAFAAVARFRDICNRLSQLKTEILKLADSPAGTLIHRQQVAADATNLRRELVAAQPHAVCPYCLAAKPKCSGCGGRGWVPRSLYESAPAELRTAGVAA